MPLCEYGDLGRSAMIINFGDEEMFNYKTSQISYKVLEKDQIIERIDNKSSDNIIILGTFCPFHGDRIAPSPKRSILLIFITGGGAVMTAWWEENAKEKQGQIPRQNTKLE